MASGPVADGEQAELLRLQLAFPHQLAAEGGVLATVLAGVAEARELAVGQLDEGRAVDVGDEGVEGIAQPHELQLALREQTAGLDRASRGKGLDAGRRAAAQNRAIGSLDQILGQGEEGVAPARAFLQAAGQDRGVVPGEQDPPAAPVPAGALVDGELRLEPGGELLGPARLGEDLPKALEARPGPLPADAGDGEVPRGPLALRPGDRAVERGQDLVALVPVEREVGRQLAGAQRQERGRAGRQGPTVVGGAPTGGEQRGEDGQGGDESSHAPRVVGPRLPSTSRSGRAGRRESAEEAQPSAGRGDPPGGRGAFPRGSPPRGPPSAAAEPSRPRPPRRPAPASRPGAATGPFAPAGRPSRR